MLGGVGSAGVKPALTRLAFILSGVSFFKSSSPQALLASNYVENEYSVTLVSIEHAARWFDYLPIHPSFEFRWLRPAIRMSFKLIDVLKHSAHEFLSCSGVV